MLPFVRSCGMRYQSSSAKYSSMCQERGWRTLVEIVVISDLLEAVSSTVDCTVFHYTFETLSDEYLVNGPPLQSRERRKKAPRSPSAKTHSLTVWTTVVFPVPASPFNQETGDLSKPLIRNSISFRTVSRVSRKQPLRSPC